MIPADQETLKCSQCGEITENPCYLFTEKIENQPWCEDCHFKETGETFKD